MSSNIAVLIDGENVDASFASKIFSYAQSMGKVVIREIYGSGNALNDWSEPILENAIHTNFTLRANRYKNSSDIALVIGAMELMADFRVAESMAEGSAKCDTIIIASSDSDFSPLAVHLRSAGMEVIGMGEPGRINPMWPKACTKFVELKQNTVSGKNHPAEEKAAQPANAEPKKSVQQKPEKNERKPVVSNPPEPAPEKEPQPEKIPEPQPAEQPAPEEKKIASSHRARVEVIRQYIADQLDAHGGRMKTGELFKALADLPDYAFDQQRSNRKQLDYLSKQYSEWFVVEQDDKGTWISPRPAALAAPAESAALAAPEDSAAEAVPDKTEEPHETPREPEKPEKSGTLTKDDLINAGIPAKHADRAASILAGCRNMRDVYNRMRRAFGSSDGKKYYEIIKGLPLVFAAPASETRQEEVGAAPVTNEESPAESSAKAEEQPSQPEAAPQEPQSPQSREPEPEKQETSAAQEEIGQDDPTVLYLLEKGVPEDRAPRIVSIVSNSPNMRVAHNELRKAFGNPGRQYLALVKEYNQLQAAQQTEEQA